MTFSSSEARSRIGILHKAIAILQLHNCEQVIARVVCALMDAPCDHGAPISPGTPTNTTPSRSSCNASGYGTPGSSRNKTRKVARTPSKQRDETEPFDSLLESFIQGLQDVDERGVTTMLISTTLHNEELSSRRSTLTVECIERNVQHTPSIKLEDLLSDSEIEGNMKPSIQEEHHLLQLASEHYSRSLRWRGMKGLLCNVIEQRQLRLRAERHSHKRIMTKYFTKMKVVFNVRRKRRQSVIRRAQLKERTNIATSFHQKRLLERSFLRWRAWCLYRRECRAYACRILAKANVRMAFHLWRRFTQSKLELKRGFQAWRQYIYNHNLKKLRMACCQQKQTVLLQECFNKWILKTAIVAGEGLLSSKLHAVWQQSVRHRALRGWLLNTRELRAYREVLRHWFKKWRFEVIWVKRMKIADRYCEQRRLKMAIAVWKAEYRLSLDLRSFLAKQENARRLKYLILRRLATERKYTMKREWLAYNLLRRCLLRKYLSEWKRLSENARALVCAAQKVAHIVHRRLTSDTFHTWKRQLHCRKMLRHHLLDSESQLINRCFSTWRKLSTSAHSGISELSLSNSEEYGSQNNLALTRDNNVEMPSLSLLSRHTAIVQSTPAGRSSDDRLGYLRDLSNRIQESLQFSGDRSKGAPSTKRTKSVVRRLFVENGPLPSNTPSSVSDSSSPIQLCSCLDPQIAHEVHEFQKSISEFSSCHESISRRDTHKDEIENTNRSTHPSSLDTFSSSISPHSSNSLPMTYLNSTMSYCCLHTAFHGWLALTRKKLSLWHRSAYLAKLLRLRRMKRGFERWRETYTKTMTLKSLETGYQDRAGILLTRSCLRLWQEKATRGGVHQAETNNRRRCLKNALTRWKMHHQQVKEENTKICRRVVLTSTFKVWIRKLKEKELLQKALSQWISVVKVARQEKQAELLDRYWCMSRAWLKWRLEHVKEVASLVATQHHNHFLLLQAFTAWRGWINSEK